MQILLNGIDNRFIDILHESVFIMLLLLCITAIILTVKSLVRIDYLEKELDKCL
jgi:hypothetical protein